MVGSSPNRSAKSNPALPVTPIDGRTGLPKKARDVKKHITGQAAAWREVTVFPFRQFTAIPFQAITALEYAEVGGMAQAAYLHLCRHQSGGEVIISIDRLARKLRCSARHVHDCLKALVTAGLIQVVERPGRASRYRLMAWFPDEQVDPTPARGSDVLEASKNSPEDHTPNGVCDPIRGSEGSDPESTPEPQQTDRKRIERVSDGSWRARAIKRVQGLLRKRTEQVTEQEPAKSPSMLNPEPIEAPGDAAPLEAGCPPAREEQPRPVVEPGQTWGELFGTPEPSPDEAMAAGKQVILKTIGLAPEGQWRYSDRILTTEALLAYPRIRAVITPDDLAEHRAANQPLGLRARL